jgi:hypothetical protein
MEFDMNKMMKVKNRSSSMVLYKIPEQNIRRTFMAGETKNITYQELVWLSFQPGGRRLMQEVLQIQDAAVTKELNIRTEPEYNMSEEDVKNLLLYGAMDEFLDALDFAPSGVIDLIKTYSISLPLNDVAKREAIKQATGFDVTAVLANSEPDEEEEKVENPAPTRRVVDAANPGRRTSGSKYTIISKEDE